MTLDLLVVCANGTRRSAAITAYAGQYVVELGLEDEISISSAGLSSDRLIKASDKWETRVRTIERGWFVDYSAEVEALNNGATITNMHPRFAVLLLREGLTGVLRQSSQHLTRDLADCKSYVFCVDSRVYEAAKPVVPKCVEVYLLKQYLDYVPEMQEIDDIHFYKAWWVRQQLKEDRKLLDSLRTYARQMIDKVAKEAELI